MMENTPDTLGEQLRAEAHADSSAFSPELHASIMETLRAKGLESHEEEVAHRSRWRFMIRTAAPLGIAAAVVIVALIFLRPPPNKPAGQPTATILPSPFTPALAEPVRETIAAPTAQAAEAWQEGKYGYLDKDARKLAIFVASQIPTVPTGQGQ